MDDQYGNPVPDDLVILNIDVRKLNVAQRNAIHDLDWYQAAGNKDIILVSRRALVAGMRETRFGSFETLSPDEYGCDVKSGVIHINRTLHRWSPENGFSHV